MIRNKKFIAVAFVAGVLLSCQKTPADLRLGYSPNLTHAQALVGLSNGSFRDALGKEKTFQAHVFHAGPSIIEALFAGAIDVAYVGPVPAINSYIRSDGEFVVISGAANGGAAFVVHSKRGIQSVEQLDGRLVLTPQLGNTQDVTARAYFLSKKIRPTLYPVSNSDHINLFLRNEVDAAWTVEPWVSRLVHEAGASVLFEEDPTPTTVIVVRRSFLQEKPDLVKSFLRTHVELTRWINQNPDQAKTVCNQHLKRLQGKPLETISLDRAWPRIQFSWTLSESALKKNASRIEAVGFLREDPGSLNALIDFSILNEVLDEPHQA